MRFTVDPTSSVPIYAQLVAQVKYAMAAGVLHRHDALPSLREVSTRLRISPLTVKKAYGELETLGIVSTEHGRGTFVSGSAEGFSEQYRHGALVLAVERLLIEAYHLGTPLEEVVALVRERHAALAHEIEEPVEG
ncbi:MAG TPA: GntR family transcriptional regulator [Armatimonadota bacterium]|jgi:GntR family transcriptional regulator